MGWLKRWRCRHDNLRAIYGDEIITANARSECVDCRALFPTLPPAPVLPCQHCGSTIVVAVCAKCEANTGESTRWSKEEPKVEGWWWCCTADGGAPSVVHVWANSDGVLMVNDADSTLTVRMTDYLAEFAAEGLEWSGPLQPPASGTGGG